jgi:hypothetical protein
MQLNTEVMLAGVLGTKSVVLHMILVLVELYLYPLIHEPYIEDLDWI